MTTFTWVGGSGRLDNPLKWTPNDINNIPPPTLIDDANFGANGGTLTGDLQADFVSFTGLLFGSYTLIGTIDAGAVLGGVSIDAIQMTLMSGGEIVSANDVIASLGATVIVKSGGRIAPDGQFQIQSGLGRIESGGTIDASGIISFGVGGATSFSQEGGFVTAPEMDLFSAGHYSLSGGLLLINGGTQPVVFVNAAGFDQSGGAFTIGGNNGDLEVGQSQAGNFNLSSGTLNVSFGEFIGQENGGNGTFKQTGGKNTIGDRLVIGAQFTDQNTTAFGDYELSGKAGTSLTVKTLFDGSAPGATGFFFYNTHPGDAASLQIAGTDASVGTGLIVGGQGQGTFRMDTGTLTTGGMEVGRKDTGVGNFFLKGGTINDTGGVDPDEKIGAIGTAHFEQTGGTNNAGRHLIIGDMNANKDADYLLTGSTSAINVHGSMILGNNDVDAEGEFTIKAGATDKTALTVQHLDGGTALIVANEGGGTFTQTGGTVTLQSKGGADVLEVGEGDFSDGLYELNRGTLIAGDPSALAAGTAIIGDFGSGEFDQFGGTAKFGGSLYVSNENNSDGEVEFDNGEMDVAGDLRIGVEQGSDGTFDFNASGYGTAILKIASGKSLIVGDDGLGVFNHYTGTLSVDKLTVGAQTHGDGTYNFYQGSLTVASKTTDAVVGDQGKGTFNQKNDTVTFTGGLTLGGQSGGNGTYNFENGTLNTGTANDFSPLMVADAGTGTFQQDGGTGNFVGGLIIGNQTGGMGTFNLASADATDKVTGSTIIGNTGKGIFNETAGKITFSSTVSIGAASNGNGQYVMTGGDAVFSQILLGSGVNAKGEFDFNQGGGHATIEGTSAAGPTIHLGIAASSLGTLNIGGGELKSAGIALGNVDTSEGVVNLTGGQTELSATEIDVGNYNPNTHSGGLGLLKIADGTVFADKTLILHDDATFDIVTGDETFRDGIKMMPGGTLEIGGESGPVPNQIKVFNGGVLTGYGLISSDPTGQQVLFAGHPVADIYSLSVLVADTGTIDAKGGFLRIEGNISGAGKVLVEDDSILEIGGTVDAKTTITFKSQDSTQGSGTLIIDDIADFKGKILGLEEGDQIILKNVDKANENQVIAATIGTMKDPSNPAGALQVVSIDQGKNASVVSPLTIQVSGPTGNTVLTGDATHDPYYFKVTKSDNDQDTTLTLTKGHALADAVDSNVSGNSAAGAGIKVGIISDSFNVLGGEAADLRNNFLGDLGTIKDVPTNIATLYAGKLHDEGRAMAEIVNDIAPGATIYFASPYAEAGVTSQPGHPNFITAMGQAIDDLRNAHVNIIIDDISITSSDNQGRLTGIVEANTGGAINVAVDRAFNAGITVVTSAGNYRANGFNIAGHATNPNEITVAAADYLAVPSTIAQNGGYLDPATDAFSSVGTAGSGKPNLTGPDGGPTSFVLPRPPNPLDPFFGTSAAAPAIGAIAALMEWTNPQLKTDPGKVANLLAQSATSLGGSETLLTEGKGYVDASTAVQKAFNPVVAFFDPPALPTPTLVSAALSQPAGAIKVGDTVQLQLTISQAVKVTGVPTVTFNNNGIARYDAAESQPDSGLLVFDYTVGAADKSVADLEIKSVALGNRIVNADKASPDLSPMFNQHTGLSVKSPLSVSSVATDVTGEANANDAVHLTLTLNKALTVDTTGGNPTLTLSDGATATYDSGMSNLGAGKLVFDYTVGATDQTPDLGIYAVGLPDATTVHDSAGNNADFSGAIDKISGLQVGAAFVEQIAVSVTGSVSTGQQVVLTITMSEALTVNTGGGSPTLTLNDGAVATYDAGASNPANGILAFDYTVGMTDQTSSLSISTFHFGGATIKDSHGVDADFSGAIDLQTPLTINSPLHVDGVASDAGAEANTGKLIHLTVDFNDNPFIDIRGSTPTLSLNDGATATLDFTLSDPSSGDLVFDYTIGKNDKTPDLQATAFNANGTLIFDGDGNVADLSAGFPFFTGLTVNSPLTVKSVTTVQTGEAKSGDTVVIKLTMSEGNITLGMNDPTLTLSDGATANLDNGASNLTTGILAFDYVVGANDQAANLAVSAVNLSSTFVHDALTNNADFSGALNKGTGLAINAPVVGSVTASPSGGNFNAGDKIAFTVNMSRGVTVAGMPTLTLDDGGTAIYTAGSSKLANGVLVFTYTVGAGQNTNALHVTGINLPTGASIKDATGHAVDTSGIATAFNNIHIDTTAPTVTAFMHTPNSGVLGANDHMTIELDMSEAVTVRSHPQLKLSDNGVAVFDIADSTATKLLFNYFPKAGENTANLGITAINLPAGASIVDGAGNLANFAGALQSTGVAVDTIAPTITGVTVASKAAIFSGSVLPITVKLSEAVTVTGTPQLSLDNGEVAIYDAGNSTPATGKLVFDYTVSTGDTSKGLTVTGTLLGGATIHDAAGNDADLSKIVTAIGVPVDAAGPAVTKVVTTPGTGIEKTGNAITFTLTMGEAVNVDTTNGTPTLALDSGGTATYDTVHSTSTSLVFKYIVGASDTDTPALRILNVDLNGATAMDSAGNDADFGHAAISIAGLFIDQSQIKWLGGAGDFATPAKWAGGNLPGPTDDALITAPGAAYVVTSQADETVNAIDTAGTATLDLVGAHTFTASEGTFAGSNAGSILVEDQASFEISGLFGNTGKVALNAVTHDTSIILLGDVNLSGHGKLTMSDSTHNKILANGTAVTLNDLDNAILGAGTLGDTDVTLVLGSNAVVNATGTTNALSVEAAAVTNAGKLEATGTGGLVISHTDVTDLNTGSVATLATGSHIDLDDATITGGAVSVFKGSTLDTLNNHDSSISGATVANAGTITANHGDLTITGAVTNTGTLSANGSHLTITGAVTGSGTAVVAGGGVLEFGGASSASVTFLGADGSLVLDAATTTTAKFTGTVSGFAHGVDIDLGAINYTTGDSQLSFVENAAHTSGVLTVNDGTHIEKLTFAGNYTLADFTTQQDVNHHLDLLHV